MKKLSTLLASLFLLTTIFGSASSFAATPEEKEVILFEAEPITDIDVLLERAKNGITDSTGKVTTFSKKPSLKIQALNESAASEEFEQETFETTQKIKVTQKGSEITETYNTTEFVVLSEGRKYETQPDSSGGVVAYSTVTYDRVPHGNLYLYKLIKVSGGWNVHDSSIILSNREYTYGASGNNITGSHVEQASGPHSTGELNAFQQTAPTSWVSVDSSDLLMGVTSFVDLSRGTSSKWKLVFMNLL